MNNKTKGFIYGAIAAASYGMNPLFTLPLYAAGMSVDTVLFYRYAFAVIVLGVLMKLQGQSFTLRKADILPLVIMGLLFSFSSLLLFMSYNYMDAGIASTILFVYPVMVAVIMGAFFKEKISAITVFFDPVGTFGHCPALSGRWQQTTLHRRNYLCFTVVSLLCHLYRRSQPVFIKNITDYQTDFLCYIIRIIGLHSPLEFLHGIANHTLSLIVGRCSGLGHSPHCRVIDLHRISHSIYRLHSYCYTRCSGACDSVIFRGPPVSRKTDSPINGRYFNDYHCRYIDYHRQVAYKKDECAVADKQKIVYFC